MRLGVPVCQTFKGRKDAREKRGTRSSCSTAGPDPPVSPVKANFARTRGPKKKSTGFIKGRTEYRSLMRAGSHDLTLRSDPGKKESAPDFCEGWEKMGASEGQATAEEEDWGRSATRGVFLEGPECQGL